MDEGYLPLVDDSPTVSLSSQGPESGTTEVVCQSDNNVITSGGGFSEYYEQPSFQKAAVARYFATVKGTPKNPYAGFNASKRAYPDVSLAGANYRVVIGGRIFGLYGTSASAPVIAGFFSNMNAARLAAGKGSVGWINPALYANPSTFVNDITFGNNKCGGLNASKRNTCCREGFFAALGWDPATGLGSVDYKRMSINFQAYSSTPTLTSVKSSSSRKTFGTCASDQTYAPHTITILHLVFNALLAHCNHLSVYSRNIH